MASPFDRFAPAETQTSKLRDSLTWSALIVIGILIYELTTQPILGVIVVCSKFGWNDFLIAYLLRRVDSNQKRGRTVSWFCIAAGLLNVVYASMFLGMFLFLSLPPVGQAAFQPMLVRAIAAFGTLLFCYLLITATIFRGAYLAAGSQTKVWLTQPWWWGRRQQENFGDGLVALGLIPLGLLVFGLFPLLGSWLEPQGILLIFFLVGVGLPWVGLTFFLLVRIYLIAKKRFLAATPFECWDCDYLGKVMVARMSSSRRAKLLMQLKQTLAETEA
jgi:hypothetical protein